MTDTADAAYTRQDWRIADVILELWVCLCADAALRRELLNDGKFLLFDMDDIRLSGLTMVLDQVLYR